MVGCAAQLERGRDRRAVAQEHRGALHREGSGAVAVRFHPGGHGNRAQAALCASGAHGAVRRTHRSAEPRLLPRSTEHGAGTGAAQRRAHRVALRTSDRFKQVNDTYGHGGGDQLLQTVAERLGGCVRDTDTVARLGGDEFVVLLESIIDAEDAQRVVARSATPSRRRCRLPDTAWRSA